MSLRILTGMLSKPAMLEDYLPWWLPIDGDYKLCDTWTTKCGGLLRVAQLGLPDLEAASATDLIVYNDAVADIIAGYGDGWRLMFDLWRLTAPAYLPPCDFGGILAAKLIDDSRRRRFMDPSRPVFDNSGFLAIHLHPEGDKDLLQWMTGSRKVSIESQVDFFLKESDKLLDKLAHRIPNISLLCGDDLASYLEATASYDPRHVAMPTSGTLSSQLSSADWSTSPKVVIGGRHMATVELRDPGEPDPHTLESIFSLPFELRWTAVYDGMSRERREQTFKKLENEWKARRYTGKGVVSLIVDKNESKADTNPESLDALAQIRLFKANVSKWPICEGSVNFHVWGKTQQEADSNATRIEGVLKSKRVIGTQATLNDFFALTGDIPGNVGKKVENVRKTIIRCDAFARLSPIVGVDVGPEEDKWFDGPALMRGTTKREMPYNFVLNAPGSDIGHFVMFGKTGSGKSALLSFMAAQFMRYKDSRVVMLDRERSSLVTNLCLGGDWIELGGKGVGVQPLRHIDDPNEFTWAYNWLMEALRMQGVTPDKEPDVSETVIDAMKHVAMLDQNERTITRLSTYASRNERVAEKLDHYRAGHGPYGEQFDGVVESYGSSRFVCFETYGIMRQDHAALMVSALFRAIWRDILDGKQPTLFLADELSFLLKHPVFGPWIEDAALTLRKRWCALGLVTQDPRHFATPAGEAVLAQMATRIFLPDPGITHPKTAQPYLDLGLSEHLLDIIADGTPKQDAFVQAAGRANMVTFKFEDEVLRICGAGKDVDKARAFAMRDSGIAKGDDFTRAWLAETTQEWKARTKWGERIAA